MKPIKGPSGAKRGAGGTVSIDGQATDKLATVDFTNPDDQLIKKGNTMFEAVR